MKEYQPLRKKKLKELSILLTNIVKNIIEYEIGEIPIEEMNSELEKELYMVIEDWIDEVDSENDLKSKLEVEDYAR